MLRFLTQVWPFSLIFWKAVKPAGKVIIIPTFKLMDSSNEYIYNPEFYATQDCAEQVMRKFNAQVMFEKNIQDADRIAPPQWHVRFTDGLEVNAGQIAKFFAIYPEEHSNVAVNLGINYIGMLRQQWEMEKREAFGTNDQN